MPETLLKGIFDSELTTVITVSDFLLCIGVSLLIGLIIALSYMHKTRYTKSFVITLALLPAVVCVVIMMVNGNVNFIIARRKLHLQKLYLKMIIARCQA